MLRKFLLIFGLPLFALTISCANQKTPTTVESQLRQSQTSLIDEDEMPEDTDKPDAFYDRLGDIYKDDVAENEQPEQEPIIGQEVENTIATEKLSEVPLPDVPMVLNQQVEKWMAYFQGRGRKYFTLWLSRSSRYVPMMKQILKDNGLPEGLIYLSMIESGFGPNAYSRAKAVGPWQFMKFTGERYGLRVNYWIDERRDPEKSTIAAAQHLKDLYDEFDHWYLAAAGYNAGAGKISKAISRYQTEDFWEISKNRYLRPETKNYVPKLLAASLLASEPEKYGFTDIVYQEPLAYEKVLAPEPVSLDTVAASLEISPEILRNLNPELQRGVTPPNYPNYELKIPVGLQSKFEATYAQMARYKAEDILTYYVTKGDTLSKIAKKHGVSTASIAQFNHLRPQQSLHKGQQVLIPVAGEVVAYAKITHAQPKTFDVVNKVSDSEKYVVQGGDTLWSISRNFNVTVSELRRWNHLSRSSIHPGQKLVISDQKKNDVKKQASNHEKWKTYVILIGDNLRNVSKKLRVPLQDLAQWNHLNTRTAILKPGNYLKFRT